MKVKIFLISIPFLYLLNCSDKTKITSSNEEIASKNNQSDTKNIKMSNDKTNLPINEAEWKALLSDDEFRVLRNKGTEMPYSGKYYKHDETGIYVCKGCGSELFSSSAKFDAHCGWPSFYEGIDKSKIKEIRDVSHGMIRTEVICANCGGHLGHVFDDGPQEKTGLRYCINSVSLGFISKSDYEKSIK